MRLGYHFNEHELKRRSKLCIFLFNRKVKKGSLLIDSSTIDPAVSKEMATAAEKMGAVFMDAPVSGGNYYILAETTSLNILSGEFLYLTLDCWM